MKVQNQRWIFPLALVWVAILIFPPSGSASSYGRVTNTEWRPIWDMKPTLNFPLLVIEMVVSGVLVYGTWVFLATRTPKAKYPKVKKVKSERVERSQQSNFVREPDSDTVELLRQYQQTIDYNWSVAKFWTVREEEQLIAALRRRFGKSWEVQHARLKTPAQGEMYSGEPQTLPKWADANTLPKRAKGSRSCFVCGCVLSPVMTNCPRCKEPTPIED